MVLWPSSRTASRRCRYWLSLGTATLLAGCVVVPPGPLIRVSPGPGKGAAQFQSDDLNCRSLAGHQAMSRAGVAGPADQYTVQRFYDDAYAQCMVAAGHVVPGYATPMAGPIGPDPALVRAIQNELQRMGYLDEAPDGAFGGRTRAGIQAFERDNGLPVTGAPTQRVLGRMRGAVAGGAGSAPAANAVAPSWVAPMTRPAAVGPATPGANPSAPPTDTTSAPAPSWVAPVKPQ